LNAAWKVSLSELIIQLHGHCNVPREPANPGGVLGPKAKEKILVAPRRKAIVYVPYPGFESLGFEWRLISVTAWEDTR
jgi:hypothetical protein